MGLIHIDLELINGTDLVLARRGNLREDEVRKLNVKALVDSGAYMLDAIFETARGFKKREAARPVMVAIDCR